MKKNQIGCQLKITMIKLNSIKMSLKKKGDKLTVTSKYEGKDNIFAYFLLGSSYYNKSTTN